MVADLPVGENLQDHVMTFLEFHDNTTRVATKPKIETPWNIMQYLLFKTGNTFFLHLGNIGTHRFFFLLPPMYCCLHYNNFLHRCPK